MKKMALLLNLSWIGWIMLKLIPEISGSTLYEWINSWPFIIFMLIVVSIVISINKFAAKTDKKKSFSSYTLTLLAIIFILISLGTTIYSAGISFALIGGRVLHCSGSFCNSKEYNLFLFTLSLIQFLYIFKFLFDLFRKNILNHETGIISSKKFFLLTLSMLTSPAISALTALIAIIGVSSITNYDSTLTGLGAVAGLIGGIIYLIPILIIGNTLLWGIIHRNYFEYFSRRQAITFRVLNTLVFIVNLILFAIFYFATDGSLGFRLLGIIPILTTWNFVQIGISLKRDKINKIKLISIGILSLLFVVFVIYDSARF